MYAIYGNIYHPYTPNVSIYTVHGSYGIYFRNLKDLIPSSEWRFSVWSFAPPHARQRFCFRVFCTRQIRDWVWEIQFPSVSHSTNHCVKTHDIWDIAEYSKRPPSWLKKRGCYACQASIALRPTWSRVVSPKRRFSTLIVLEIPGDTLVIPHSDSLDGIGWFCSSTFFFVSLCSHPLSHCTTHFMKHTVT